MNPDRSATEFVSVQNDIISLGSQVIEFSVAKLLLVFFEGAGKGVVNCNVATLFFIESKERELGNPKEIECGISFEKVLILGNFKSDSTQDITSRFPLVGGEKNQITRLDIKLITEILNFVVGHTLYEG